MKKFSRLFNMLLVAVVLLFNLLVFALAVIKAGSSGWILHLVPLVVAVLVPALLMGTAVWELNRPSLVLLLAVALNIQLGLSTISMTKPPANIEIWSFVFYWAASFFIASCVGVVFAIPRAWKERKAKRESDRLAAVRDKSKARNMN